MPEENNIKYWKISPGERAFLWDKCRENNLICLGWCHDTDWKKTEFGDLTKNPKIESIKKILREEYPVEVLFSWKNVPGSDSNKLQSFLKKTQFEQYFNECDYKDAKIEKTNSKTISVSYDNNFVDIILDENSKKAILKFNNNKIYKLIVKKKNGNLNIHEYTENQISRWAEIIKDFFDIKPSHKVIVYHKDFHINAMADVSGEYEFNEKIEYPHTKAVEWIKIFDPPYNIKPLENELQTKLSLNRTVIEITKTDWDTIYAKGVGGMITDEVSPIEAEAKLLPEGAKTTISVNKYERNPQARKKCIENYGTKCQICDFSFKEKYGSIGEDFIEVHHKKPISEIGNSYEVNPVDDLIPVCSDCHSMLHRKRDQTIDVEKLKELIKQHSV